MKDVASSATQPQPKISAIVPAFNSQAWLRRGVESLLVAGGARIEVVIVDDGSDDGSWELAKELAAESPQVAVWQHPDGENHGVSATRNLGIEESSGEYLCFLDGDDYVHPHRFERAAAILDTQPEIDGVYDTSEVLFASAEARETWGDESRAFGLTEPIPSEHLLETLLRGRCWATSAILFRRSLLANTGVFDPQLRIAEDCNLWFRMACVGNLVAGDLARPVSVYWRRADSAYQPSPDRTLDMIEAMGRFLQWMIHEGIDDGRSVTARHGVRDYVLYKLGQARLEKDRRRAWSILRRALQISPELWLDRQLYRHLPRMLVGR